MRSHAGDCFTFNLIVYGHTPVISHDATPDGEKVVSLIGSLGLVPDCVGEAILDSPVRVALVLSPVPEG